MAGRPASGFWASLVLIVLAGLLAGCSSGSIPKDLKPVPRALTIAMHEKGMADNSPIFIRIFKEESDFEVWKQKGDGTYALLKTYSICQWSGQLGPKKEEGDYQAPEGFYTVTPAQMNPNSDYYLSFNIGYPNAFDSSLGRTGGNLMVHGACSSAGCYSMTDESAGEIFALARDAFNGGQRNFQIQAFPFRMTPENMAKHYDNPNIDFWRMLKVGYDSFELTRMPPKVDVCDKHYVFDADAGTARFDPSAKCPAYSIPEPLATALVKKTAEDDAKIVAAVMSIRDGSTSNVTQVATIAQPLSKPPILSVLGLGKSATPAPAPVTTASIAAVQPVAKAPTPVAPQVASVATPVAPRPALGPAAPPVLGGTGQATLAQAPAFKPAAPAAINGSPTDPIGQLIDRKFWWDDSATP